MNEYCVSYCDVVVKTSSSVAQWEQSFISRPWEVKVEVKNSSTQEVSQDH